MRTKAAENETVIRKPNVFTKRLTARKDIANASDRLDGFLAAVFVHFVSQTTDEHINEIGLRVEAVIPDMFQNHGLRHDASGIAHQILEQGELARLQLNLFSRSCHL